MVKTKVNLEDNIYVKLGKEMVEKYGNTKGFSKLVNEKLANVIGVDGGHSGAGTDIVAKTAGLWKMAESGVKYVRKIRGGRKEVRCNKVYE